ncbi:hypothetical protein [Flavobacterium sp.]|uniref:hypothetical protein n=1 Tax=Flavobacterium sp. TaxID=239 RepID=UPI0026298CB6|nr:hypothetical protein [Flavobacterium sp.]
MLELITFALIIIAVGSIIYILKYKNKEKPKIGIKRNSSNEYFKDYVNMKLYLTSIFFILLGLIILITILILEIVPN